ncbi:ABC transporter ATP-binding protein [Candidatus Aerophobetes bacterium]|nr:ABC transporter ATP-binding protein [Candidatus Aerophobetes bacterium]
MKGEGYPVIKIKNIGKIYRGYRGLLKRKKTFALKKINLEIKRGEIFGLLGLNAAGKTTLLKILLGFVRPSWGEFEILGRKGINTQIKRKIGYLPEEPKLYDFLSAEEFLFFCGRICGLKKEKIKERTKHLLDTLRIAHAAKTKIGEFSRGMNQRLAIACAILHDPDVLFLDEPLSGLDPLGRRIVKELLLSLKKEGKTIFFSSHILSEVEQLCDRIGILHQGELLCVEETNRAVSTYPSLEDFFMQKIESQLS